MSNAETLEQLSQNAGLAYPDVDSPLAIVAKFEPAVVDGALESVLDKNLEHKKAVHRASSVYDHEAEQAGSVPTEAFRLAALDFAEAEGIMAEASDRTELAHQINSLRDRLSFPMRSLATALSVAVLGIGSTVYSMEGQSERYGDITTRQAKSAEEIYTKSPLSVGILAGVVGGFAAWGASGSLAGREAHRRARKIIAKKPANR